MTRADLCAVSGMPMRKDRKKRSPHAPSIDRINSAEGYTPGNCRLVCYIVNCGRNMFTDAEFMEMCEAVVAQRRLNETKTEHERAT